jgi:flagellar motor switch protein FliG
VRKHLFAFEDIARLSVDARARLFDEVPTETTIQALCECEPALQGLVLSALSPRARRIVEAELAANAKVARMGILQARRAIADLAMGLASRSLIKLEPEPADR